MEGIELTASTSKSSVEPQMTGDGVKATVETLPGHPQAQMFLGEASGEANVDMDVTKMGGAERRLFVDNLLKNVEEDNLRLLLKVKQRMQRVGLEFGEVEVRFNDLKVEAEYRVAHGRPLPTLWNTLKTILSIPRNKLCQSSTNRMCILKGVSGILKPSRITLLLGPPGCGKTTFLKALAGKLDKSLKVSGEISYNGYELNEFVPRKTAAYVSQDDLHISEMTVRETLDFSARCQGVGERADIMKEICKREKQEGILPEPDIDTYMKATSLEGLKENLQTDYILKILGLDVCADTVVGDAMTRGISGGQKRRLTTGEMVVGPARALFMDEISNGLDSSTTFQIVTCLQQQAHVMGSTILVSLLQPDPETFGLFDDVILMGEGQIVYHGPRQTVLEFFDYCGLRCPPRKGAADFLQEVLSEKDQAQYWQSREEPPHFMDIEELKQKFDEFPVGRDAKQQLLIPADRTDKGRRALVFESYSTNKWELFRACLAREWLLMKRNSFVHVFKSAQLVVVGLLTMTVFIRTRMKIDEDHASLYLGALFYALTRIAGIGIAELSMTVSRLEVFYRQRDSQFYPAWAYSIPAAILKIPVSMLDAIMWTAMTYYSIGYSPEPHRFFRQTSILFLIHQVSLALFRAIAALAPNQSVAATSGLFSLLVLYLFGGFVIPKPYLPAWLQWGFWLSPVSYAEIGVSVNEFLAPRWQKVSSSDTTTIGHQVLGDLGIDYSDYVYWLAAGALFVFWLFLNIVFTCALTFVKAPGRSRQVISQSRFSHRAEEISTEASSSSRGKQLTRTSTEASSSRGKQVITREMPTGMVLPFVPITLTFENVQYSVETPKNPRLQLLREITGAFRPGVLTALMGMSGAGKSTLMDVLSGRKTGGTIEGEMRVGGYPKVQATYARISGYCEQTDLHLPQLTIEESVVYSARLRLPPQIDLNTRAEFVAEVLRMMELDGVKDELVSTPVLGGIPIGQRKRLTMAVELVSNPSMIFMDEPTSGLDARAAAIVMRVVKNIVCTGRTIVCTIHQPNIDIFEAFDELILMKRGGQMIYLGELGRHSSKLINYFESIPGVPKIKQNYNPATWMLEISTPSFEAEIGVDYATLYQESHLYRESIELVTQLRVPAVDSRELQFCSKFPQNQWEQFKACLWKQHLSYWRSPNYNLVRLSFIAISSLLLAALLWQKGRNINGEQDLLNILGALYIFVQFTGAGNCSSVLPYVSMGRTVLYRERFAGMYSPWIYALTQVAIEIPYIFLEALVFLGITYPAVGFDWSVQKVFLYFSTMFCTFLYFNYFGMMLVALTPTYQVAAVFASFWYTLLHLFSGFIVPGPRIPKWWTWCFWICPTSWSLRALFSSQYGDSSEEIMVDGQPTSIAGYLERYYGYKYNELGLDFSILLLFPLLFAVIFSVAIVKLNFQKM